MISSRVSYRLANKEAPNPYIPGTVPRENISSGQISSDEISSFPQDITDSASPDDPEIDIISKGNLKCIRKT